MTPREQCSFIETQRITKVTHLISVRYYDPGVADKGPDFNLEYHRRRERTDCSGACFNFGAETPQEAVNSER